MANHLGLFDQVLATEAGRNLKGKAKLQAIQDKVGPTFVYAGDGHADVPIWKAAQAAVLVDVSGNTAQAVRRDVQIEREFPGESGGLGVWIKALRVHQWLKNLLLFVPLLTAFSFFDLLIRPKLTVIHSAYFTRTSWKNFFTRSGDFSNTCMCSVAAAFNLALVRTGTFV